MRKRLAEIYHKIEIEFLDYMIDIAQRAINDDIEDEIQERQQFYVDKLLEYGVIVPPCKVGDTVYFVARNSGRPIGTIDEIEIVQIAQRKEGFHAKARFKGNLNEFEIRSFKIDNYSFFLTREEAEAALVNYESSKIEKGGAER